MRTVKVPREILDRVILRDKKIKSCEGIYSLRATADFFGLSHEQVRRIWKKEPPNDCEPPNITGTKRNPALYEDALILLERGLSPKEAALQLGVKESHLREILKKNPRGIEALSRWSESVEHWQSGRQNPRGSYGYASDPYEWANRI